MSRHRPSPLAVAAVLASLAVVVATAVVVVTSTGPEDQRATSATDDGGPPAAPEAAGPETPTASPFPTPAPAPTEEDGPVRPGPDTTGPAEGVVLVPLEGRVRIEESGAVFSRADVDGCIDVEADDVTIRDVRIRCGGTAGIKFGTEVEGGLVERVEIIGDGDGDTDGIMGGTGVTVRDSDISGVEDGIKLRSNSTYEGNWIHDLAENETSHNDGMQGSSSSNVLIRGNAIDHEGQTSSILLKSDSGSMGRIAIIDNWLSGGSYTLYVRDGGEGCPEPVFLHGNVFAGDGQYGDTSFTGDDSDCRPGIVWGPDTEGLVTGAG